MEKTYASFELPASRNVRTKLLRMAEDAKPGGKLHRLMERSEAEFKAGKLIDLNTICT
jgi:hypothetical protein